MFLGHKVYNKVKTFLCYLSIKYTFHLISDDNPWGNLRPSKEMRYKPTDQVPREKIVETAVIVDKEYVDQWRKDFPTSRGSFKDISMWITDSLNWVSSKPQLFSCWLIDFIRGGGTGRN